MRVGDVVEKSPHTLDAMLMQRTSFEDHCTLDELRAGCTPVAKKVYVQPLEAYRKVLSHLRELHVKRVVVVANAHANLTSYGKSCNYSRRVGSYFRDHGFEVRYRLGQSPDDDLRFIARCFAVVPTGASGFGQLAAKIAEIRGAVVVMPLIGQAKIWEHNRFDLDLWGDTPESRLLDQKRQRELGKQRVDISASSVWSAGCRHTSAEGYVGCRREWHSPLHTAPARRLQAATSVGLRGLQGRLNIGLCISGQAVDRSRKSVATVVPPVFASQREHLLEGLRKQGRLDVFYVLDGLDAFDAEVMHIVEEAAPRKAIYWNTSDTAMVERGMLQFQRLGVCLRLFKASESEQHLQYDWLVRSRPDLFFYGPLPMLGALDPTAVHTRMRCYNFAAANFTEHHLAADTHHLLRQACGRTPLSCDCHLVPPECPHGAVRVEDAFGLVPRALGVAYFSSHAQSFFEGVSSITHDRCPRWENGRYVPGSHASPECRLTHSLLTVANARVVPTPLYVAIARTRGRKWGAGARLGSLYLSSPLVRGRMDSFANTTYRCKEHPERDLEARRDQPTG